ncbi:MAG TPA: hypothetical protein PK202_03845 [Verrucomicrobiota bacterium]|nr:hypothetical protein [Verrucomicrobiota bacterium]HPI64423.1 hypothetical protein [Verrucomicrobiota bacterium]
MLLLSAATRRQSRKRIYHEGKKGWCISYTRRGEVRSTENGVNATKSNSIRVPNTEVTQDIHNLSGKQRASAATPRYSTIMRIPLNVAFILLVAGCSAEPDWVMVSSRDIPSPDDQYFATVFEMCCHCTTGDFPQVSLRRPGDKLGLRGNVLAGGPGDQFMARWLSATNLVVEYQVSGPWSSYPSTTNIDGVAITFNRLGAANEKSDQP